MSGMVTFKLAVFRHVICKLNFYLKFHNSHSDFYFRMMSSMAKEFRARNLTYSPFEMDFSSGDVIDDLKREVGNEHSSELFIFALNCTTAGQINFFKLRFSVFCHK